MGQCDWVLLADGGAVLVDEGGGRLEPEEKNCGVVRGGDECFSGHHEGDGVGGCEGRGSIEWLDRESWRREYIVVGTGVCEIGMIPLG